MRYVCSVCGYVYDEAKGIPDSGIAPGTHWEELPGDWVCPLCGADKTAFAAEGGVASPARPDEQVLSLPEEEKELSALQVSALCSNLSKACEKQYKAKEAAYFAEIADYFKSAAPPEPQASFAKLFVKIEEDLSGGFPTADAAASAGDQDRGALQALLWSQKVTRIHKSLLTRYETIGEAMIEHTGVYVCTACGFVSIGDKPPDLCPVCKVPSWKFDKIEGR